MASRGTAAPPGSLSRRTLLSPLARGEHKLSIAELRQMLDGAAEALRGRECVGWYPPGILQHLLQQLQPRTNLAIDPLHISVPPAEEKRGPKRLAAIREPHRHGINEFHDLRQFRHAEDAYL